MSDTPTNIVTGGTILGVVAGLAYKIWRLFKTDRREEKRHRTEDTWAESLIKRVQDLESRLDKMEKERNEALARATHLEQEVYRLGSIVESLRSENEELKKKPRRIVRVVP